METRLPGRGRGGSEKSLPTAKNFLALEYDLTRRAVHEPTSRCTCWLLLILLLLSECKQFGGQLAAFNHNVRMTW